MSVPSPVDAVRRYLETLPHLPAPREELCSPRFWKAARTEFLATLLLVVLGCGLVIQRPDPHVPSDENVGILEVRGALALGLAAATVVQCIGHISGGHANPAISVALLVTRHISVVRAMVYVSAQCLGALVGATILYGLTPAPIRAHFPVTAIHPLVHPSQAFGIEFLATLAVSLAVLANLDPQRADMGSKALSIGLAYTVGHLFAFRSTGASMNPARSLGPAVVMNQWRHHWVYWVGPILGGIIGGFTYEYTHDSSRTVQGLKRSFRRTQEPREPFKQEHSILNSHETELTATSTDCRV